MVDLRSFSIHIPFEYIYPVQKALQKLGESMPKQHKRKRTKWKNRKKK